MLSIESTPEGNRSGFVALIGRPNVGKSTLINQLIGEKVAITSPIAQTTRNRLRAILTTNKAQLILLDTPGIHKPRHLLGERLVQSARKAVGEVDIVLAIFDSCFSPGKGDAFILNLLRQHSLPIIVALNKCDLLEENKYEQRINEYKNFFRDFDWPVFCCSAVSGEGCNEILKSLESGLPLGPHLYPPEMKCDQPEKVLLAELIREQVLINTREEVPHSVAVSIDRIETLPSKKEIQNKAPCTGILATIFVERKSQKGILIGKGGSMLKNIGQGSRTQIQLIIDGPVYLELFVKVVPNWRSKPSRLSELGYLGN